jgi:hypothetical protein
VGNEDFLRRVNKQVTGVEQETSAQEGVRDKGSTSAAAEAFFFEMPAQLVRRRSATGGIWSFATHIQEKIFQALMHFSFYLMIAALILLGLQLAYAFYQLAVFIL